MTQFQHTLKALLEGRKTETSWIVKPQHNLIDNAVCITQVYGFRAIDGAGQNGYFNGHRDRSIFERGKDYAIQPARGVKSVGRYRVEAIWRQDARTLTLRQVKAEGFGYYQDFWETWCKMHDPSALNVCFYKQDRMLGTEDVREELFTRPAECYQAWRMTIKILWDTIDYEAPAVKSLQIVKSDLY